MIAEVTKKLRDKLASRRTALSHTRATDIRMAVIQVADTEDGDAKSKPDLDHIAELMHNEGISEADFFASVAKYRRRKKNAQLVARLSELKAKAEESENALQTFR